MPEESTTPDLIGLTRLFNEAFNRRDWDAVESFYAPDAVSVAVEGLGTFKGAAAIRANYEEAVSLADDFHIEIEEIIDLGNGVTFVVNLITGHPVRSSGELRMRTGTVVSWTEAVIERETGYMDIDEARAAAERLAEERG
jgi:ketosteroid isomerase-like protein